MKRKWFLSLALVLCLFCGLLAPPAAAASGFSDVPAGTFYTDAVGWAVGRQITNGTSNTMFSPDNTCSRAEMATFLYRLNGSHPVNMQNRFQDVQAGTYYYDPVLWAATMGVTSGVTETAFAPGEIVTRAQAVTMLYRFAGSPPTDTASPFADVPAGAYYHDAAAWGSETGVVRGTSSTTFSPNDPCTRAHIVTFLYRDLKK